MLRQPQDANEEVTLLSLDPGSETMGICILKYLPSTKTITHADAFTVYGSKLCKNVVSVDLRDHVLLRINAHKENLINVLLSERPDEVIAESSFFNPRRPHAYGVLIQVMDAIRAAAHVYEPYMQVHLIPPSCVKIAVGAKSGDDKNPVRTAVLDLPDLNYDGDIPIDKLDEHSIDALAVAYAKFKLNVGVIKNVSKTNGKNKPAKLVR
jgi:Holliday junction resolvasome RuvABC endonuclease subunit